jgi:kynurenine formamidase
LERAMLGKSVIVDLSHTLSEPVAIADSPRPGMPGETERQSPGGADPTKDLGTRLNMAGLIGSEKRTVAQVPSRELLMSAVVVNIAPKVAESADYRLTVEDLKSWERQNGRIPRQSAVLLHTGWSRRWAEPAQYVNRDAQGVSRVPGFSPAAVAFLVTERQVRGLGVDACAADTQTTATGDAISSRMPPGVWQLENLVNLERLPAKGAKLVVAPLRIEAMIAPARVMAILP